MVSGGSLASWSLTCAATIVTVQLSPAAKSAVGSRVKVVGPPETVAAWAPLVVHVMPNQLPATSTGSEKVMARLALIACWVAPLAGVVAETDGAWSIVKANTWSAVIASGGSKVSWSVTCAANTVVVHASPAAKSALGLTVNVVGPPVTTVSATLRVPLVGQTIWNQFPPTSTGSVKVTVRFASAATPAAPPTGTVALTDGG